MRFQRIEEERPEIPTASTSDIVFLLLIFFMVSTVFKTEQGLQVELPSAMATKKVSMKHIAHIWVGYQGDKGVISIDDRIVPVGQVKEIMQMKKRVDPNLIVSIMGDKDTPYWISNDIFGQLIKANALRVSLSARKMSDIKQ